jgi:hypothetical protein
VMTPGHYPLSNGRFPAFLMWLLRGCVGCRTESCWADGTGSGSPEPAFPYLPSMENGRGSASPRPSRGHSFGREAAPLVPQRSIHARLGHTRWAPEEDVVHEDDGGPQILKRLGRAEEAIGVEGYDEEERPSKHRRRHRHEGDTAKHGAGKSRSDSLFARALVAAVSEGPSAGTARYRTMR